MAASNIPDIATGGSLDRQVLTRGGCNKCDDDKRHLSEFFDIQRNFTEDEATAWRLATSPPS
jgi:hypothetical protein